jgi:5'-nucleotidase
MEYSMKKKVILKSSILAVATGFSFFAINRVFADDLQVQFMGVNDFHGALEQTGTARLENETVKNAGTAPLLATYMNDSQKEFETENAGTPNASIRVQAGDMVGASPANSALLQDEPTVKVFNEMNFEYGTLGNHEFDEGLGEFNRIMKGEAPTPGQFNKIVDEYPHEASKQEIVIANLVDKDTNKIPFDWKPYTIKEIPVNDKTVKVGFIGVVTTEFPNLVLRKNHEQYRVLDEAESIAKYARELNGQGVHAIAVLAHVAATSKNGVAEGPAAEMIKKLNQLYPENSVDLVFAGHNHQYTNGMVGNTLIVQGTSQGKAYSDVRGVLDTDTGDFVKAPTAKIIAVDPSKGKVKDAKVQAIINEADETVKKVTEAKIGSAEKAENITRELNAQKESAVGDLVTAAQLDIAKKSGYPDIDFAFTNNGGIRSDLVVKPDGTITWGAAQAVQPFGNILQVVEITGDQIYKALDQQYDEKELYFLQMAGIKYTYTKPADATEEKPYKVVKAYKADGTEIDRNKTYKAIINDFLYGGGDGFSVFRDTKLIGAINPDTEVFIQYIEDVNKAGKKLSASILGNKIFVKKVEEKPTPEPQPEPQPSPVDPVSPVNPVAPVTPANPTGQPTTPVTPVQPAASESNVTNKVKPVAVTYHTGGQTEAVAQPATGLPKTGQEDLASTVLSLFGMTSLALAGFVASKKREG